MAPNMLLLFAIVLLPVATALMGTTTRAVAPYAIYSGVLLLAGLSKAWVTHRALAPDLIQRNASKAEMTAMKRRAWLLPTASALFPCARLRHPGLEQHGHVDHRRDAAADVRSEERGEAVE